MQREQWLVMGGVALLLGVCLIYFGLQPSIEAEDALHPLNPMTEPGTPLGCQEITRGTIDVSRPQTLIGEFKGKIYIQMWGCAVIDPRFGCLSPNGKTDAISDGSWPVPGAHWYQSIANVWNVQGNQLIPIGTEKELTLAANLSLGPNDTAGKNGIGFEDNSGTWNYKICGTAKKTD